MNSIERKLQKTILSYIQEKEERVHLITQRLNQREQEYLYWLDAQDSFRAGKARLEMQEQSDELNKHTERLEELHDEYERLMEGKHSLCNRNSFNFSI